MGRLIASHHRHSSHRSVRSVSVARSSVHREGRLGGVQVIARARRFIRDRVTDRAKHELIRSQTGELRRIGQHRCVRRAQAEGVAFAVRIQLLVIISACASSCACLPSGFSPIDCVSRISHGFL